MDGSQFLQKQFNYFEKKYINNFKLSKNIPMINHDLRDATTYSYTWPALCLVISPLAFISRSSSYPYLLTWPMLAS